MRPYITLKLATSLDGCIATRDGESKWITSAQSRALVHQLRANHEAVLIGIETALADDPELTVRLSDYEGPQPARIILDTRGRLPLWSKLVQTARVIPTYVVSAVDIKPEIQAMGVRLIKVATKQQHVDLELALEAIEELGIKQILVEGGSIVATSFLKAGLFDRLEWFRAPCILGGDARSVFGHLHLAKLEHRIQFQRLAVQTLDEDIWETYELI